MMIKKLIFGLKKLDFVRNINKLSIIFNLRSNKKVFIIYNLDLC